MREALPGATAVMKPSVDPGRLHRRLEIGDVGRDRIVAGIGDRRDADRRRRARPGGDAGLWIGVGGGELGAIPAVAEARQHDLAGAGPSRRRVERAGPGEVEPAEALPRIAPPRAVLHALGHRLAELTVSGDVDADIALTTHHLRHRLSERLLIRRVVDRFAGFVRAMHGDQPVRARQAADMAGGDMVTAGFHGFPSLASAQRDHDSLSGNAPCSCDGQVRDIDHCNSAPINRAETAVGAAAGAGSN